MMRGSVRKPTRILSRNPKSLARQAAYRKGRVAEFYAALYYILRGYAVVQSRYKTPLGEIDLILKRGRNLVFCEVKARDTLDSGVLSVSAQSRRRIEKAALSFLTQHPKYINDAYRFDVISVVLWGKFLPIRLLRLDNAWDLGA
ncbi:MAG: YraN family protein [Alphaproteobacteria bacterium]